MTKLTTFKITSETDKKHFLVVIDNHKEGSFEDHIYADKGWQDRVRAMIKKYAKVGSEVRIYQSLKWGDVCEYINNGDKFKKITVTVENLK